MHVKEIFWRYLATQKRPLVLDIGANIGTHSLFFAALGASVHSFEPLKKNFALLHCSVVTSAHVHKNIRINNFGLGAKRQEACMVSEDKNMGGTHAEAMEQGGSCSPQNTASIRTLDWYWEAVLGKQRVFFLKADVEGFEPHILEGANTMFQEAPPYVMVMEYVPSFIQKVGGNHSLFLEKLAASGYMLHDPWTNATQPVSNAVASTDLVLVHRSFLSKLN